MATLSTNLKTDLSTLTSTEQIVKIDENTAKRYKVVEETIDLEALRREKEGLEADLNLKEPTTEMLIQEGMGVDPYYRIDKTAVQARIDVINKILGI